MDLTSGPDALVIENNMIWDCKAVSTASRIQGRIDCVHGIECIVRHNTIVHLDAADSSWLVRFSSVLGVGPVEQFHSNIITQNITPENPALQPRLDALTQYFLNHGVSDPTEARAQAFAAIAKVVREQSYVLAFSDTFFLLGGVLIIALISSVFLKASGKVSAGGAH